MAKIRRVNPDGTHYIVYTGASQPTASQSSSPSANASQASGSRPSSPLSSPPQSSPTVSPSPATAQAPAPAKVQAQAQAQAPAPAQVPAAAPATLAAPAVGPAVGTVAGPAPTRYQNPYGRPEPYSANHTIKLSVKELRYRLHRGNVPVVDGQPVVSELRWSENYSNQDKKLWTAFGENSRLSKQAREEGKTRDMLIAQYIRDGLLPQDYQDLNA